MLKKLKWLWMNFWGNRYYIEETDRLPHGTILIYRHKMFIGTKEK